VSISFRLLPFFPGYSIIPDTVPSFCIFQVDLTREDSRQHGPVLLEYESTKVNYDSDDDQESAQVVNLGDPVNKAFGKLDMRQVF